MNLKQAKEQGKLDQFINEHKHIKCDGSKFEKYVKIIFVLIMCYYIIMPKKPKYDYNIDNIQTLQNKGMSIIQIANHYGWCKVSCQAWINRNYTKSIEYKKK